MRIIGLLSWFDEQPAWLAELVASLATAGVDHLIAIDGAYMAYPDAAGNSGSAQGHVIEATALGAGMGVTVHQPSMPWRENEIEKRTFLFSMAGLVTEPGDWLLVADADEVWQDADGLRAGLEATQHDVAEVQLREPVRSGGFEWTLMPARRLFRAHARGIRVVGNHAHYVDGDGRDLWNAAQPSQQVPAEPLWHVNVLHRPCDREAYRTSNRNEYYALRRELDLEAA